MRQLFFGSSPSPYSPSFSNLCISLSWSFLFLFIFSLKFWEREREGDRTWWRREKERMRGSKSNNTPFFVFRLTYLGDSHQLQLSYPLINHIKKQLSEWKSCYLSMRSHLVLLKFVMSSLPVYLLSFFKVPTCIISSLESNFKCFFGGDEITLD